MSGDVTTVLEEPSADSQSGSAIEPPSLDALSAGPVRNMHDVFSDWWRRAILAYLDDRGSPASLTALTRQVLAWYGGAAASVPPDWSLVERTHRGLRHGHVRELRAADILGYDPEADTVWLPDDVAVSVPRPPSPPG